MTQANAEAAIIARGVAKTYDTKIVALTGLDIEMKKGEVKLDAGIVDDEGRPRVRFAIEGALEDGWHPLTSMDVV